MSAVPAVAATCFFRAAAVAVGGALLVAGCTSDREPDEGASHMPCEARPQPVRLNPGIRDSGHSAVAEYTTFLTLAESADCPSDYACALDAPEHAVGTPWNEWCSAEGSGTCVRLCDPRAETSCCFMPYVGESLQAQTGYVPPYTGVPEHRCVDFSACASGGTDCLVPGSTCP